ncbi:MAG TPA: efflux RND transporter periplasmic adaptor subunit, partial [Gemmataceae bacterium]|nr:efflux RND transporter periplasmic adaptor subunit [Gemmataceae bacterium]
MRRLLMLLTGPRLLAAISAGLTGCSQGPAQTQPPPPKVTVSYAIQRQITDYAEYPGRVAAVNAVQVRARVSGYLQKVNFKDGDEVQQGQILYVIDPRLYKAALDQAQAQVSLQEAQLTFNEAVYNRNAKLLASGGAVSLEDVQQSRAQRDTTRAALEAAKASVAQAKLNLEWTNVTAPIGG